jgi:hypothetical protein
MKVFWSWQSDTPGKTGRHFIRDALKAAIKKLKDADDVIEPTEREIRSELHIDHDRSGVPGSPDLVGVILEKIEQPTVWHLLGLGYRIDTEGDVERVCLREGLEAEDLDKRLDGFGWEDAWDNFNGPQAKAFHLLQKLDLSSAPNSQLSPS